MNDILVSKIRKLNLPGMLQCVDMRVEQAIREKLSYIEFLELLINDEHLNRGRNRRNDYLRKAKLPMHKTLEEFNFSWQPCINRQEIYNFGVCEFIRKKENIAFIGLPGTGKTHAVTAIGVQAIEHHRRKVRFLSTIELVNALELEKAKGKAGQIAESLTRLDGFAQQIPTTIGIKEAIDLNTAATVELGVALANIWQAESVQLANAGNMGVMDAATAAEEEKFLKVVP